MPCTVCACPLALDIASTRGPLAEFGKSCGEAVRLAEAAMNEEGALRCDTGLSPCGVASTMCWLVKGRPRAASCLTESVEGEAKAFESRRDDSCDSSDSSSAEAKDAHPHKARA